MLKTRIYVLLLLLVVFGFALPVTAQSIPPNYVISISGGGELSEDRSEIIIRFDVSNNGGDATDLTTVRLVDLNDPAVLQNAPSAQLRPLKSDEIESLALAFPATLFPKGSRQPFRIEIISGSVRIKSLDLTLEIPAVISSDFIIISGSTVEIPALGVAVNLEDPMQLVLIVGGVAVAVILLVIFIIILRLLFRRPATFGTWQPPYANVPPMNPDTLAGRRQQWQQHAENHSLPVRCNEGMIQARKLLVGMDGKNLSGWRIIAVRLSQYDMYGRVARSQVLASGRLVKRLDRVAHKNQPADPERLFKQVRPVAKGLAGHFKKKISTRTAMLPIALDVRLQGAHGDVRIMFELYQCQQGQWQQIDHWEPEMTVLSKTIYDSFTYTIYGQTGGETLKEFRQRVQEDITRVLAEIVRSSPEAGGKIMPDTVTNTPPVQVASELKPVE